MTSQFVEVEGGLPEIEADPGSELDYSVSSWLEGLDFTTVSWSISPAVAGSPYNPSINASPITIDGVTYAAGKIATAWVKGLTVGQDYVVTAHATFTANRIDDRSFKIKCRVR